jgi:3-oxoacyl-[acyl-carrier protein] reductase
MTSPTPELSGRVALVTGGARNIGRAIALALGEAGAAVAVNTRASKAEAEDVAAEIVRAGGRAASFVADISDPAAVARMAGEVVARFGGIDILINNAAVRLERAFDELDLAGWRETLGINLDGPFLCIKACLPHLRKSDAAAIVNMGGMTSHTGAKRRAHIVASKAGLVGLTRALALELAPGITVNCVAPGLIDTTRDGSSAGDAAHRASRPMPLGRLGPPSEVAAMVRHLVGPSARYITGQVIHVNGGNYLGG